MSRWSEGEETVRCQDCFSLIVLHDFKSCMYKPHIDIVTKNIHDFAQLSSVQSHYSF